MSRLREAAQAVMVAETLGQMAAALDALRDALAEPDEVLAEREACAKVCLEEAPSLDGQLCADAIRARGNT